MITENRRARAHIDWPLIAMIAALAIFGVYAVCVATFAAGGDADAPLLNQIVGSSYARNQAIFLAVGAVVLIVVMNFPYDWLRRLTVLLYFAATALVFLVWIFNRAEGVKAWLDIFFGFTIQPSEFIKLAMILMLARVFARQEKPLSSARSWMNIITIVGIPCLIILMSGEMGSLLVILFVFIVMLWFADVDWRLYLGLGVLAVLAVLALYGILVASGSDSYRLQRILAFFDPETYAASDAYQMRQSQIAIGSGGLTGIGTFVDGSRSQLNYVPADWTDFIFATIGEAWGFIGCSAIILMYLMIILRMLYLAINTRDRYGMLVIIGVMAMLLFHVFENIGMTLGLMPITGIPLPFLSYGGSNMVTNVGGVALVLNVTKNRSLSHAIVTPQTNYTPYRFGRKY